MIDSRLWFIDWQTDSIESENERERERERKRERRENRNLCGVERSQLLYAARSNASVKQIL